VKTLINFVVSVCLYIDMKQLDSHCIVLLDSIYIFLKYIYIIHFWIKFGQNKKDYTKNLMQFLTVCNCLSPSPLMSGHWGCYRSEAVTI
jgi:hypothetical protein